MATQVLPQITPVIDQWVTVNSPWQGQGLDVWHALVWNASPYALIISVSTSTFWLAPYTLDFYEFPAGVYSFGIVAQQISTVPGGSSTGTILVTAFDQSSPYDGAFPVALTPPTLEQTFSLIDTGTFNGQGAVNGVTSQPFDAIVAYVQITTSDPFDTDPVWCVLQSNNNDTFEPPTAYDAKGRYTAGGLILSCSGPGLDWAFFALTPDAGAVTSFAIYGVTIADTQGLLGPPVPAGLGPVTALVTPSEALEPLSRGTIGTQLAIEGTYTGPALIQIYQADAQYAGSSAITVLVDDTTTAVGTPVKVSIQRPAHGAWMILVSSTSGTFTDVGFDLNVQTLE